MKHEILVADVKVLGVRDEPGTDFPEIVVSSAARIMESDPPLTIQQDFRKL
jgi:hypothetical protein